MKKLHGLRILGSSWHLFLPLLVRLYELQEIESRKIIRIGKEIVGCSTEKFGQYYEVFKMMGGKISQPHLHLVKKVGREGKKDYFILTDFGRNLGRAYLDGDEKKAKRMLFLRCVVKIPQFWCFLEDITKSRFIYRKAEYIKEKNKYKYHYFSDLDETITLDKKIKTILSEKGYDATCNPQTIDQFIRFCKGYKLIEDQSMGPGEKKYILKLDELVTKYPDVYVKIKPQILDLNLFAKVLNENYLELSAGHQIFVPIPQLREKVQKHLKIRKEIFDHVVVELEKFNPNKIQTRAGPADLLGEPLLKNTNKLLIKIKRGKLFIPKEQLNKTLKRLES